MTTREVKQWLSRGRHIRWRIEALERAKQNAWDAATRVSPSAEPARGGDRTSRRAERYGELSEAVDQERARLDSVLAEITGAIAQVEDNDLAALLTDRYICGLPWREVAANLHYSESNVKQTLHPKALRAIQDCTQLYE